MFLRVALLGFQRVQPVPLKAWVSPLTANSQENERNLKEEQILPCVIVVHFFVVFGCLWQLLVSIIPSGPGSSRFGPGSGLRTSTAIETPMDEVGGLLTQIRLTDLWKRLGGYC